MNLEFRGDWQTIRLKDPEREDSDRALACLFGEMLRKIDPPRIQVVLAEMVLGLPDAQDHGVSGAADAWQTMLTAAYDLRRAYREFDDSRSSADSV